MATCFLFSALSFATIGANYFFKKYIQRSQSFFNSRNMVARYVCDFSDILDPIH